MTQQEAIDYLRQTGELKIYKFQNGFVITENEQNMGYNYVIQTGEPPSGSDLDNDVLSPKVGEWLVGQFSYIDENEAKGFIGRPFGYRVKVDIEPIFTDDYLLSTKMENDGK